MFGHVSAPSACVLRMDEAFPDAVDDLKEESSCPASRIEDLKPVPFFTEFPNDCSAFARSIFDHASS